MAAKIVPVIMAGGKGTRLWPLSRATAPKQFIQFVGEERYKKLVNFILHYIADLDIPIKR